MPGLPNTRVIHDDWSVHHQATAAGGMTALCVVTRAGEPAFNELLGHDVMPEPTTLYKGACRVRRLEANEQQRITGDREITIRDYMVSLLAEADAVMVNDTVTITGSEDDTQLVGRTLRIRDVAYGSLHWQRNLSCELLVPVAR